MEKVAYLLVLMCAVFVDGNTVNMVKLRIFKSERVDNFKASNKTVQNDKVSLTTERDFSTNSESTMKTLILDDNLTKYSDNETKIINIEVKSYKENLKLNDFDTTTLENLFSDTESENINFQSESDEGSTEKIQIETGTFDEFQIPKSKHITTTLKNELSTRGAFMNESKISVTHVQIFNVSSFNVLQPADTIIQREEIEEDMYITKETKIENSTEEKLIIITAISVINETSSTTETIENLTTKNLQKSLWIKTEMIMAFVSFGITLLILILILVIVCKEKKRHRRKLKLNERLTGTFYQKTLKDTTF